MTLLRQHKVGSALNYQDSCDTSAPAASHNCIHLNNFEKKDFAQPAVHLLGTPVKDFNLNLGDKEHNHTTDVESVFRIPVKVRTGHFLVDLQVRYVR